jgi:hypothetical protein
MEQRISVKIGADAGQLISGFNQADKAIKNTEGNLLKMPQAGNRASGALDNLGKQGKKSGGNMLELSRVIQDLPFGFAAISNNLTQLIPGVGALGLAFSGLVAAVTFAQVGFSAWTRGIGGANNATKEASKANEEYKKSIQEAFSSVAQEAAKVEVLVRALRTERLTRDQRKEAIEQLQQIAPAYFNTLDTEKVNIEALTRAYDNYTKGLQRAAEGKVLEKQLEGIIEKRLELEKVLNPPQFTIDDKGRQVRNVILDNPETLKFRNENQAEYNNLLKQEELISGRLAQIKPAQLTNPLEKIDPKKIRDDIQAKLEAIREIPVTPPDVFFERQPEVKNIFQVNKDFEKYVQQKFEAIKIPARLDIVTDGKPLDADKAQKDLQDIIKRQEFEDIGAEIGKKIGGGFDEVFRKQFQEAYDSAIKEGLKGPELEDFMATLQITTQVAGSAILGLGDAFGTMFNDILSGKDALHGFGESLKNTFKQVAVQLAKTAAIAAVLSLLTGGIAGGGLSFIGAFGKLLGMNQGGLVPGTGNRDTVPAMLTPGEFVVRKQDVPKFMDAIKSLGSYNLPQQLSSGALAFASGGFVPNVNQVANLAANRSAVKLGNFAVRNEPVQVVGVIKGNDIALLNARVNRSQRRGF